MTRWAQRRLRPPLPSFAASLDIEIKGVPRLREEMRRAVHTTEGIGL